MAITKIKCIHCESYKNKGSKPETKKLVAKMSVNGKGIRDISRVLGISQNTVISVLKKQEKSLQILTLNM